FLPLTASSSLSLHDALPISESIDYPSNGFFVWLKTKYLFYLGRTMKTVKPIASRTIRNISNVILEKVSTCCWYDLSFCSSTKPRDRKSTRLNSSHVSISYAV